MKLVSVLALVLLSSTAHSQSYFVPTDSSDNLPVTPTPTLLPGDEEEEPGPFAETEEERRERLQREEQFLKERRAETIRYVECYRTQLELDGRADQNACDDSRSKLRAMYNTEIAQTIVDCLELSVNSLRNNTGERCQFYKDADAYAARLKGAGK